MENKVAVVTGANKGIGLGVVEVFCRRGVSTVYLTSRDIERGVKAVKDLKNKGLEPIFHQLDVTDKCSIKTLADYIKEKHGGLDILVNNAGVAAAHSLYTTYEESKRVIDVNYRSLKVIQEYLYPILNERARVINVSSNCGHISNLKNNYWIKVLKKDDLTTGDVDAFVDWFLESVKYNRLQPKDFAENNLLPYRVSKIAICALTRVQQKNIGRGVSINSIHPGFVVTDMTQNTGFINVEQASKTFEYLALDADQGIKGKYIWSDKTEQDWCNPNLDLYCKFNVLYQAYLDKQQNS